MASRLEKRENVWRNNRMSTRGLWGYRKNNEDKLLYNHYDSYPSGLGKEIVEKIKTLGLKGLNKEYETLEPNEGSDTFDNWFIYDSLMCEHGYIINLDDNVLEYWEGWQEEPHDSRYQAEKVEKYYPCKLALTFPLNNITEDVIKKMEEYNEIESERRHKRWEESKKQSA